MSFGSCSSHGFTSDVNMVLSGDGGFDEVHGYYAVGMNVVKAHPLNVQEKLPGTKALKLFFAR